MKRQILTVAVGLAFISALSSCAKVSTAPQAEKVQPAEPVSPSMAGKVVFENRTWIPTTTIPSNKKKTVKTNVTSNVEANSYWIIEPGSSLERTLKAWAKKSGWDVSWELRNVEIQFDNSRREILYAADFKAAVDTLFKSMELHKKGYLNTPYEGNSMMRIHQK